MSAKIGRIHGKTVGVDHLGGSSSCGPCVHDGQDLGAVSGLHRSFWTETSGGVARPRRRPDCHRPWFESSPGEGVGSRGGVAAFRRPGAAGDGRSGMASALPGRSGPASGFPFCELYPVLAEDYEEPRRSGGEPQGWNPSGGALYLHGPMGAPNRGSACSRIVKIGRIVPVSGCRENQEGGPFGVDPVKR